MLCFSITRKAVSAEPLSLMPDTSEHRVAEEVDSADDVHLHCPNNGVLAPKLCDLRSTCIFKKSQAVRSRPRTIYSGSRPTPRPLDIGLDAGTNLEANCKLFQHDKSSEKVACIPWFNPLIHGYSRKNTQNNWQCIFNKYLLTEL